MINGRTTAMTVNEFDQLDRPLWTDHDYPGSGQDEGILHLYDRHFENGLLIMGTATLINSLSHNHRGQLTRLNRPGDVLACSESAVNVKGQNLGQSEP